MSEHKIRQAQVIQQECGRKSILEKKYLANSKIICPHLATKLHWQLLSWSKSVSQYGALRQLNEKEVCSSSNHLFQCLSGLWICVSCRESKASPPTVNVMNASL